MLLNKNITGVNKHSPWEPTGWPQSRLTEITRHWLELLSVVQSDTPQHISCHTQSKYQQQPINTKEQKYPPFLKHFYSSERQHVAEHCSDIETESSNGNIAYWSVKRGGDVGILLTELLLFYLWIQGSSRNLLFELWQLLNSGLNF